MLPGTFFEFAGVEFFRMTSFAVAAMAAIEIERHASLNAWLSDATRRDPWKTSKCFGMNWRRGGFVLSGAIRNSP
jgi:hypothetical protein